MNALTLTEDFQISTSERNAYKVALAKAEGDLLIIAAHRRLGLNTDSDEDGFPYYVWEMADVARDLAELSVRKLVPASWQSFFESLCHMARNIDEAAWTFFFGSAVKDEEGLMYEEREYLRYGEC
ncbi:hypothetical protein [Pantoea ananatis]|uniref:hypothetical protein n=1 Tax=Pantoea ananas TaxID=553 RepID=UPI00023235E6|nr:hypothetical protein [Pantoea ananatis]AER34318.1 hypothetical protein PAGR_g3830 [Pantoea ananatis PA13]ASN13870.1 hypothetical protein B7764_01150 [Pantoea ananatis]KGL54244.1 hypothetical protein KR94_13120 [Pantoea ananatis]